MDAGVWTAIAASGPAGVVVALFFIYGIPKIQEFMGWQSAQVKEAAKVAAELAKEGPTMVIAELRLSIERLDKKSVADDLKIASLETRYAGLASQHRDCELELAHRDEKIKALEEVVEAQCKRIEQLEGMMCMTDATMMRVEGEVNEIRKHQQ